MIIEFCDTLFSATYHTAVRKKRRLLSQVGGGRGTVRYADHTDRIDLERTYARWKISNLTLDEFFDVKVVVCPEITSSIDQPFALYRSTIKQTDKRPIFVGLGRQKKAKFYRVIKLHQVKSLRPIEMTEKTLAQLFGLTTKFDNLVDLYRTYDVKFKFLLVNMQQKRIRDGKMVSESPDVPGERMFADNCKEIRVGKSHTGKTFWVPYTMFVNKKIFCRKNPDSCAFWCHKAYDLERHEQTCIDQPVIQAKLKVYGNQYSIMDDLVNQKLLPEKFRKYSHSYIATFDIETLEKPVGIKRTDHLTTDSHHLFVSVAVSTNLPGFKDRFFCRKSSDEADGTRCISLFFEYLQSLQVALESRIPDDIKKAIEILQEKSMKQGRMNKKLQSKLEHLQKFKRLNVYGFNSGKLFDSLTITIIFIREI